MTKREALEAACEGYEIALRALERAAAAYAKAETLAYSKAHPRRQVIFCAAMGSTSMSVNPGGYFSHSPEYDFKGRDRTYIQGVEAETPEFLNVLTDIESEYGFRFALGGSLLFECKGGKVVRDLTHW